MISKALLGRFSMALSSTLWVSALSCSAGIPSDPALAPATRTDPADSVQRSVEIAGAPLPSPEPARATDAQRETVVPGEPAQQGSREAQAAPAELRRLRGGELNVALVKKARKIIREHNRKPFGTDIGFELDGKQYVGRIERHFHPVGGPLKPRGWHPGCSLFVVEPGG